MISYEGEKIKELKGVSGIYVWESPSGKFYVGQAKDLYKRHLKFFSLQKKYTTRKGKKNTAIDNAREKYSDFSQWKYYVAEFCCREELNSKEEYWIDKLKSYSPDYGYNLTRGGEGTKGSVPSSAFKKGRKRAKEEIEKAKITRELHKQLGLIDFGKGRRIGPMKGKSPSKETREKISNTLKGHTPWNKGKSGIYKEETLLSNKSKHKSKPVVQLTLEGVFIKRWDCMGDASKELGIFKTNISSCCRHYRNTHQAGGFKWEFADPI